ncbi:MAG: hypothetical protein PVH45_01975, partial [Candidatus Omnitrophota bacterium]
MEEKKEPIEPDIEEQYERPSLDELPESILELMRKADVKSVERLFQIGREEPAEGAIYAVTALGVILRERESEERIHTTVPLFLKIIALNRGPKVAMAVLGEFEDTLRTTKLETKIYNNVSDDLINIVERRHDNIGKYTLKLIENLLGRSDLDGDSFRSLSVRVMRQSLLDKESPFEQPLEVLENILLKAEGLKDFHYQMAFYLLEEMVKANPELLEQAITVASNFVKSREKLDPVISDYVERFFRDIAMEGTVSFDHVMRAFANILSTGGVAPDVYRKIAFLMERLDVNMSFFKRNYTLQEMREFILACVNATKKDLNLAKPVLIGLASTEPKAFDENTLLKMSGYYPEGELRFLAFFVTQRIGKEPRTKGVQKMLERKVAFKNGPGNLSNRARKILGRGKRKVLIYHSVEDGMGDELIRVSTIAQALLDLNPELKIVYYTNRTNIPDNNRVTVKNLKDGFKEKDSFDMVIDYHGADDKDEADKRLSRIKTRIRCICEDARFEKFSPNKIIIDGAEVLLPKPGYNVYDGVYRFCAEMGLPFKVGEEGPRTFLYGRIDLDCEAWWTENVEERRGSRPVFIFNGFGGSFEEKGITSLDAQAKAIEDLIDHGIFVVITPNGQPWGTKKVTEDIIERIAPKYSSKRNYIAITPEPGKMPRLLKHAVAKSDLTVTVEGGLGHMAYNLGKRFLIIPVKESGDLSIWMSYARTINQQTHGDAENLTGIFSYIYKKGSTAARLLVLGLVSLASVAGTGCVESGSVPEIISSVPEIIAYPVGAILAALAIYAAFTIAYHFLRLVFHVLFRLPIKLYRLLTDVVPRDLAIVEVAEEGLAFPENGKVVFKDTELASRLREEGVEFLMGDKLISKRFLKKLKKKSRNKDLDIKQFLKKNHVYPVKLHGQDFDQTLLGDVRERLRDSFRLLSVRYPQTFELFVKAVASIATKFNYDIYQKDHFLDEIKTLWHTTYRWREKGMPVYKYLLFLLKLNEAMDEVLASPGVKPETAGAFTWTIHWPNYYTAEGSLYILEKLAEKWRQFNDPGNAHVFFNIGVYILPGIDTGYGPGNKRFARKVMKKVIKATEHTFEHNPKFATLIEILQKKVNGEKIVFDGAEYTIREVSAPKADLGLGESSFRMVLVNEETGAEKQVECRWDYAYYAGREKMGAGVCRLLGQPAYAVDIYKIFEMDDTKYDEPVKMEFAWYMVEVPPSTDAEIEKAIDGKPEEVKRRLRGLGAIFAIEYALGAYGIEMGEIKLNSDNSYFRTTWKNVATWRNKTPHSEKYKGALEGAETDYLGDLLLQENGKELVAEVLDGFTQALGRMRREKDRIFSRVIKLWLGEAELEVFKGYFEKGLAVPDEEITKEPSKGIMRKLNIFRKIMEDIEDPETHAKLLRLTREFLRFYPINSAASIAKSFYENGFEFEDLSPGTIRAVVTLDDYIGGNNYRSEKDFSPGIYSQYFSDKLFLNIRFFLAKARYEELKELIRTEEISPERIVEAFLLNNQNSIISQTSELIRDYSGTRGVLRDLKSLSSKFNYEICTKERLEETLKALGISISDDELERIMREHGFKVFEHEDKLELFGEEKTRSLIIPLVFDNILSVYRGSAEYDNVEASYLTHAITTAIAHYANKGGEVKGESEKYPHGANAFHEFDLGFMMIEGRNHRSRDKNVTLAFHYEGVPLPEYARKRTVALKDAIVAGHISQLMEWQLKERRAKQNIHKILKWITEGVLGKKELQKAINILKKEILVLKDECGLKKEYFDAVFGYLDEEFFTELKHGYRPSRNNHRTLRKLLIEAMKRVIVVKTRRIGDKPEERVQHPWLKRIGVSKTILNYLHNEEKVRKGTFSETDVSTVKMEDITGKDGGEDQLEDSQLDTSGDARGEGFLGRIGKTRLVIAGIAAGLAGKAALAAEATEEIGGFLGLSSLTWVGVIGLVAMFGYMAYRIITSREYTGIEGILSTVAKRQNKQELDKLWEEVKKV